MREVRITLKDENYDEIKKDKQHKKCTWREYLKLGLKVERDEARYEDRNKRGKR